MYPPGSISAHVEKDRKPFRQFNSSTHHHHIYMFTFKSLSKSGCVVFHALPLWSSTLAHYRHYSGNQLCLSLHLNKGGHTVWCLFISYTIFHYVSNSACHPMRAKCFLSLSGRLTRAFKVCFMSTIRPGPLPSFSSVFFFRKLKLNYVMNVRVSSLLLSLLIFLQWFCHHSG